MRRAILATVLSGMPSFVHALEIDVVQSYFVPVPEEHCLLTMRMIYAADVPLINVMNSSMGIVGSDSNTLIVYDQWEDGFEDNLALPTQTTTQIWGDNNTTNGMPPGLTQDVINAGTIINLTNNIPMPRNPADIKYDGCDKFIVSKPVATTRAQYATNTGPLFASAVQTPDVSQYGTEFISPVGTDTSAAGVFSVANISVIAAYDPTMVYFDNDRDGTNDVEIWLDQGGSYLFTNVLQGARIKSNKRIMAHLLTGEYDSRYWMRWFTLFPTFQWDDSYFAAVGSRTNSLGNPSYADVYLYNPNTNAISVQYETKTGSGTTNVPANSTRVYRMPFDTGGRFYTTNQSVFATLTALDGEGSPYDPGTGQEWGYSSLPESILSTMIICGWGSGSRDMSANGNPVWVSSTTSTTLYVDFDADPNTGDYTDPVGNKYDISTNVAAYETVVLYDTVNNDNDQTGTRVYTISNAYISACWGQDAKNTDPYDPYLDMGCEILPFPTVVAEKRHLLHTDVNGNGFVDSGDQLKYTIILKNVGWVTANNVYVYDEVPFGTDYVTNSTTTNGISLADNNTNSPPPYTAFPLDEAGIFYGSIPMASTGTVSYVLAVSSPFPSNLNNIVNNATLGSSVGFGQTQDPEVVVKPGLAISKTSSVNATNRLYPGSNITFTITVQNTGTVAQSMVRVDDYLPSGLSYVSNSTRVMLPPAVITNRVRDEFNAVSYANNDGTVNWLNNWQEVGDDGNVAAGDIRVQNVLNAYVLTTKDDRNGAWRMADLSDYTNAVLSYGWRRFLIDNNDSNLVYVSSNGGGTWVPLVSYFGNGGTDAGFTYTNINITSYIAANTAIRFYSPDATVDDNEGMYWDNVQIEFTRYGVVTNNGNPPPTLATGYSLGTGQTLTVTFQATVDDPASVTQVVNSAGVISAQHPAMLLAYATNSIAYADLAVFKQVNTNSPNTNDLIVYTIVVTNLGPDRASSVQVTDLLPDGVTYVTNARSRGTYTATNGIWDIGTLTNSTYATLVITGRVNVGTGGQSITNTATKTRSNVYDPVTANDQSNAVIVVQSTDIAVSKSVDNLTPSVGTLLTYTIIVTNTGSFTATGIKLLDLLPSTRVTYSANTVSQGTYVPVSGVWTVGTVNAGSYAVLTLKGTVNAGTENTTITNTAAITAMDQADMISSNNSFSVVSAVSGLDLAVLKSVNNANPNTNDLIAYTVVVTNLGPANATGLQIADALPSGVTYVGYGATRGVYTNAAGRWYISGTLTNGLSAMLVITARVNVATGGNTITNTASVAQVTQADFNSANNSSSAVIVVQLADLGVTKTVDKPMVDQLAILTYTITLTNNGPDAATNVVLYDLLPSLLTYTNSYPSQGSYSSGAGTWTVGTVAANTSATLVIEAKVNSGTLGRSITNSVRIQTSGQQDPVSANNSNSVVSVVIDARFGINKTASAVQPLYVGETNSYTIAVTNLGNMTQTGVYVEDILPVGMTYVADSAMVTGPMPITNSVMDRFADQSYGNNNGTTNWLMNWDENATDDNDPAGGDVMINVMTFQIGGSANQLRRQADLSGATNIVLSYSYRRMVLDDTNDYVAIQMSSAGYTGTWTEVSRVAGPADEILMTETSVTVSAAFAATNTAIRFLSSSSANMLAADMVRFDDLKLEFVRKLTVTVNGGTPPAVASGYTLGTNESLTITLDAVVEDPLAVTQFVNTASVASDQQLTPATAVVTSMAARANLSISKVANKTNPGTNEVIWFTVVVSNSGPHTARAVEVSETWPGKVVFSNAVPSQGTYATNDDLWAVGNISSGSYATLVLTGRVNEVIDDIIITNTVELTQFDQYDSLNSDDSASAVIQTLVVVGRMEAFVAAGQGFAEWETVSEINTAGFLLYRKQAGGEWARVTEEFLPAVPGAPQGGIYRVRDNGILTGATCEYRLDEIEMNGRLNTYGPFTVVVGTREGAASEESIARVDEDKLIRLEKKALEDSVPAAKPALFVEKTGIGGALGGEHSGSLVPFKIAVSERGVYVLSAAEIAALLDVDAAVVSNRIISEEICIRNLGSNTAYLAESDGSKLYFFGEELNMPYTDENVYRVTWESGEGMGHETSMEGDAETLPTTFRCVIHEEKDRYSATGVSKDPEGDFFLWEFFSTAGSTNAVRSFVVHLPSVYDAAVTSASITVRFQGTTTQGKDHDHHAVIKINGNMAGEMIWRGATVKESALQFDQSLLASGSNTVEITAILDAGIPISTFYLDSMDIEYERIHETCQGQIVFEGTADQPVDVRGMATMDAIVLELLHDSPKILDGLVVQLGDNDAYSVSFMCPKTCEYAVFEKNSAMSPDWMEIDSASDWLAATNAAQFVIITIPSLAAAAERLAVHRRSCGLTAAVVLLEDIYDEFGYGIADPNAIRRFLSYARTNWLGAPRYLVLAGEGTHDFKGVLNKGDNLLPPMMIYTPSGLFASDSRYGDLDGDGAPELAVGRLPALTDAELNAMVDKIIAYEAQADADWQHQVALAADVPDRGGDFTASSESLSVSLAAGWTQDKIYLATQDLASARADLFAGINEGRRFLNFYGHGGLDRIGNNGMLIKTDMASLTNVARLPVLTAMTCVMGWFGMPGNDCLGESLLLHTNGGAIAVWAPAGLSFNAKAASLAQAFYRAVLTDGQGILGDAIVSAKSSCTGVAAEVYLLDIFNLLGDPATVIAGFDANYTNQADNVSLGEWKNQVFTWDELQTTNVSGNEADADGDLVLNAVEYALGRNARNGSDGGNRQLDIDESLTQVDTNGMATVVFTRRKGASVGVNVQVTDDLTQGWGASGEHVVGTTVQDDGNGETETVKVRVQTPDPEKRAGFVRLLINVP